MLELYNKDVFDVNCDLIVIPISTDGGISESFLRGFEQHDLVPKLKAGKYKLGDIEIQTISNRKRSIKYIAYACTVENHNSGYFAIRSIGKLLGQRVVKLRSVRTIASPVLGTGAGGLEHLNSINIVRNSFYEVAPDTIALHICANDLRVRKLIERESLDINTPSSQLVLGAEIKRLIKTDFFSTLKNDSSFYYQLAADKFQEYSDYKPKQKSFFASLEREYQSSGLPFGEFLDSIKRFKEKSTFLTICGELVSYIDFHAYRKNLWNAYPDKRVMAVSAVRQRDWIINLLRFRKTESLDFVSPSIRNALVFLMQPEKQISMLSEHHRKLACQEFLWRPYDGERSINHLIDLFRSFGIETKNRANLGILCTRLLYHPLIKPVWQVNWSASDTSNSLTTESQDVSTALTLIMQCLNTKSKRLDIGNCGLQSLDDIPELFECTHLEELILSNEWAEYEDGLWKKRDSQNKGYRNKLNSLPRQMQNLKNLRKLYCGGDWNNETEGWNRWEITSTSALAPLVNLEYLNLSNNNLTSLRGLDSLKSLKTLHLNNNYIKQLAPLAALTSLEYLNVSNNLVSQTDPVSFLTNLRTLDLHNNQITNISPLVDLIEKIGISKSKWQVNTINIAKNPLELPPMAMVELGKDAVLNTIREIRLRGKFINRQIKVILVGNSEVGKSTLLKYLDSERDLDKTHYATLWMDAKTIESKYLIQSTKEKCILNVFDFGGHDYYHDTHHLFYGPNTVYILLWDHATNKLNYRRSRQEVADGVFKDIQTQDYPHKYWLDSVKYFIKDVEADNFEFNLQRENTYTSTLLLMQNKASQPEDVVHLNNQKLVEKYPFIHDIISCSILEPRRNMQQFDYLITEILNNMKILDAVLPRYYEDIQDAIRNYNGAPCLTFDKFINFCNEHISQNIDSEQCRFLLKYLNHIGAILCTQSGGSIKVYPDKAKIIRSIHDILRNLDKSNGEFTIQEARDNLESSELTVDDVINIMVDFKMIFKHPFQEKYIAPLYLPAMPQDSLRLLLNDRLVPYRRIKYGGFIHKHVLLSVFKKYSSHVAWSPDLKSQPPFYYWKDSIIIKDTLANEIVMIKFNLGDEDGNASIDIFDIGNGRSKSKPFIEDVLKYIHEINDGFETEEMVTLDGTDYVSVALLNRNAQEGKLLFNERHLIINNENKNCDKPLNLKDFTRFLSNSIKKKKVVISYSKKDVAKIHILIRYLKPLVDIGLIEHPWYCSSFLPGDDWDAKIKHKFDEADLVFFMISSNFYSTQYIIDHEIKNAIDRYNSDQSVKIIPVLLEAYDWSRPGEYNLQRFSALPYQAKAISDYKNEFLAWNFITACVKMMLEKDLDPGKPDLISRDIQELYERQVAGKLDNNS